MGVVGCLQSWSTRTLSAATAALRGAMRRPSACLVGAGTVYYGVSSITSPTDAVARALAAPCQVGAGLQVVMLLQKRMQKSANRSIFAHLLLWIFLCCRWLWGGFRRCLCTCMPCRDPRCDASGTGGSLPATSRFAWMRVGMDVWHTRRLVCLNSKNRLLVHTTLRWKNRDA